MELIEAIKSRKSIRGFKSTPVPQKMLAEILDIARFSPSGMNMQPWEFVVLTGASLDKAKQVNVEQAISGAGHPGGIPGCRPSGPYRERQVALGRALFKALAIGRDDTQKRKEWGLKGTRFFDAPAAILICVDEAILNAQSQMTLLDIGIVIQSIALLAVSQGLETCMQAATVAYASALRKALDIPESKRLILGIAIGYPDWDSPVNQLETGRAPLDSMVSWKS